jgi:phage repressor protein C with HTH and peptisase S24 domain
MDAAQKITLKGAEIVAKSAEIQDSIKKKGEISLRISNDSMAPTIAKGDRIKAVRAAGGSLRKGSIVLLVSEGEVIVRKVLQITHQPGGVHYRLTNDKPQGESTVPQSLILGKVVEAKRGSQVISFDTDREMKGLLKADLGSIVRKLFNKG